MYSAHHELEMSWQFFVTMIRTVRLGLHLLVGLLLNLAAAADPGLLASPGTHWDGPQIPGRLIAYAQCAAACLSRCRGCAHRTRV